MYYVTTDKDQGKSEGLWTQNICAVMRENRSLGFLTSSRPVKRLKKARGNVGLGKKKNHTICEAKTKMLISCAVTAQLICIFVFTSIGKNPVFL